MGGHFKSKFGIRRERSKFVFTPAFRKIIGPHFHKFESCCCAAYNVLRRHADLLATLFSLMLSCGMPELQTRDDVEWLTTHLRTDLSEAKAAAWFKKELQKALKTRFTQVNTAA